MELEEVVKSSPELPSKIRTWPTRAVHSSLAGFVKHWRIWYDDNPSASIEVVAVAKTALTAHIMQAAQEKNKNGLSLHTFTCTVAAHKHCQPYCP